MQNDLVWTWSEWTAEASSLRAGFAGLLFDLDGTLVDTLPLHYRAYAEVLAEYGLELSYEQYRRNAAGPARVSIPRFLAAVGADPERLPETASIHQKKKARFAEILGQAAPPRLPAARELELCGEPGRCALVTSAARAGATLILQSQGWSELFGAVVCGDDVLRGKPDPEPYLRAAERLNAQPDACLVFEDAPEGIAAGLAAGMQVVDVSDASAGAVPLTRAGAEA